MKVPCWLTKNTSKAVVVLPVVKVPGSSEEPGSTNQTAWITPSTSHNTSLFITFQVLLMNRLFIACHLPLLPVHCCLSPSNLVKIICSHQITIFQLLNTQESISFKVLFIYPAFVRDAGVHWRSGISITTCT